MTASISSSSGRVLLSHAGSSSTAPPFAPAPAPAPALAPDPELAALEPLPSPALAGFPPGVGDPP